MRILVSCIQVLALLICAVFLAPAQADDLEDARAAADAGDYDTALAVLMPLAEEHDREAEYALGVFYYYGLGVESDYEESAKWFRRSAEQGYAKGQSGLGLMYASGWGVEQNYEKAREWLRKAADQGLAEAQAELGLIYLQGSGVEGDYDEALALFGAAADQGNTKAQVSLATMYEHGLGVKPDIQEAMRWTRLAAENGDPVAQHNMGASYATGYGVPFDFVEAMAWYRKAADQGYAEAQYKVGWMYANGEGVEPNTEEAARWYAMAAEQGHPQAQAKIGQDSAETSLRADVAADTDDRGLPSFKEALEAAEQGDDASQFMVGAMYLNGDVVEQDYLKAAQWFRKSYENPWGFTKDGKIAVAIMFHNGLGYARDYVRACYLFEEAANIGNPFDVYNFEQEPISFLNERADLNLSLQWFQEASAEDNAGAQFCLAVAYFRGLVVDKDQEKTVFWLERSANLGNAWAQYYLAYMYTEGDGVQQSDKKAAYWLEKAALQEFADAQTGLAIRYHSGWGVPEDIEKAKYWMRKAIENGDTDAMEFWGWLDFGEYDPSRLAGSFDNEIYAAPNELFRARYQLSGGSKNDPCCEETVQDTFDERTGRGTVVMSNEYGALNGVIYGPASLVDVETGADNTQHLEQWFYAEVINLFLSNAPEAKVLHEEKRNFDGMNAWVAAVEIPGGGVIMHYSSESGQSRQDSVRGLVVFQRGNYVYALMCETNVLSFFGESRTYDPNNWDAFLTELSAFYSTMKFKKS